ncbi:kinesin-like nuclear fusion protein [Exophiala dermatitidis]|uniref:Kinesin-like protein n=1 Tax=Exophiala dermatitidis TaxID=5970 RepID=A0AAN6EY23_EXODE|nr:kinesin-like nuclear fusion protein [Exophiala dermatitidis]KAJ4618758.1 kinesin-like nuclear fusion protein [Exophiala dermatitidis]KAJ4694234.1 kinesin-like nuclear fusion protein [Exophiala dermatitidis]KAJ8992456.1 kinesin-like nuclear fusion protein [Exophiala dermatitidis]
MADTENFVSQLPQPTRHTLPSPQKQLTELSASAHNSRNAMPPPTFLGHKRQGSNLPEPASKRATLAERAGQPIRSIPAAPRSNAPVHPTVMSTTQSRNPSSFSQSQRINSHFSKSTSISATPSSFSASVGSGIRPPSIHASSSLARPKSSLAKEKAARGADARPATALGTRGGNQNGPNKQAWDPEEQYGNMERMYEDVCRHYKQAMEDNVEAKEINISYKSTIANLERERKELTESMIALRCELETTKYRLEAAERAAQELRRDNEEEVEELKREHRIDSENMRQSHREDLDRLKADHREEIRELKRRLEDELEAERSQRLQALAQVSTQGALEKQRHEMDLQSKEQEIRTINMEIERLKADLEREKMLNNDLRQNLATAGTNAVSMESARQALQAKIEFLESDNKSQSEAYAVMERRMNEALEKAAECENKLRKEEMLRRKLHNQVQELKGNIRVFCRVRPTIDADQAEETAKITFPETDEELKDIEVKGPEETNSLGKVTTKTHAFSFDRVFNPSNNNAEIFEEISQLIQSALDGYNVCIFAYGQTGSGKTFTMSSDDGMIPRALRQIYSTSKELESRGWKYTMEGSFVEVYNEELRDLLGKDGETNKKHEIRHDMTTCETTITDVTTVCLDSQEQVEGILAQAMARRSVAATKANERSSRSHSVFILKLSGYNSITGKKSKGTLNLVDLAGSERLSHSKVEGARLKETQNINKSLSCLGDVIGALGQQQAVTAGAAGGGVGSSRDSSSSGSGSSFGGTHIPYRNSKLTYLLQFSLGGNSKTLMFVMVAPEKKCLAETITSLKFADKVSRTRIGVARKIK